MAQAATQLENGLPRLFEPNTLLPSQFFTALQRRSARTPEQRLMFAILFDAVSVYCRERDPVTSKERRLLRETQRGITNNDRTWVFSFLRICDALDLDAGYIRRGLRELRDTRKRPGVAGPPPAATDVDALRSEQRLAIGQ
jgi:hypothetical protein